MFVQFGSRGRIVAEGVEADRCGGVEADRTSVIVASVDVSVDVMRCVLLIACMYVCMYVCNLKTFLQISISYMSESRADKNHHRIV